MLIDVTIPPVGESITSGTIAKWHKNEGDFVRQGEALFTLETDKVSSDLEAQASGILHILAAEGEEVDIGAVVATIAEGDAPAAPKAAEKAKEKENENEPEVKVPQETPKPQPAAKAVPSEAITIPAPSPVQTRMDDTRETRRKMSPLRRKIATHLVNAQHQAAILTTFNECDMSAVMTLRKNLQEPFKAKHGIKLGFMSFFIKAVVEALKTVPQVNARMDGNDLIEHHYYDIGVAVGTERGLIVPVLRDCDQQSFAALEHSLVDYATRARDGKIQLEDLQGGVFTISNGGVYGSLLSTPILNPPQSGILGMHTIQERPVALNGQVVIRPMMYLALSYDHRVIDGKEAVTFLVRVKECLEDPTRLLVEA